ncbi:MAG TPA: hypothetical protein PL048_25480 [Leptospiraceae bacterium]|nr:hypothetical protein [Leptospiraceae bacterium]
MNDRDTKWLGFFSWDTETESEHDQRILENRLVQSISEYRKKELENIHLSENFNERLKAQLSMTESESYNETLMEKILYAAGKRSFRYSIGIASMAAVCIMLSFSFYRDFNSSENFLEKRLADLETDYVDDEEELQLLSQVRKNPGNIILLQKLEEHYVNQGNTDMASRIHYKLENISK